MALPLQARDDAWSAEVQPDELDPIPQITAVYARKPRPAGEQRAHSLLPEAKSRVSFAPARRPSWNRSLNTRGRSSICGLQFAIANAKQREDRKDRPPRPPGRKRSGKEEPHDFRKEITYFQEIDAFELLEESPSPKHHSTWTMGLNSYYIHDLSSILQKWRISKLANSYRRSGVLFDILETPILESGSSGLSDSGNISQVSAIHATNQRRITSKLQCDLDDSSERCVIGSFGSLHIRDGTCSHAEFLSEGTDDKHKGADSRKESFVFPSVSLYGERRNAFIQLLEICRQSEPLTLSDVFSQTCEHGIVKIGEGTYGEAFRVGDSICKIVPIDGDSLVNGEIQKRSEEVLEEVLLSLTLNNLRGQDGVSCSVNSCKCFIETRDFRICRGAYDPALVKAWEDWDSEHGSENDNPKEFSENQCYIVFVLAYGGKDLESFVLLNYEEAQSLLIQVAISLAVAEVACEFEHRDLHWGNILLSRKDIQCLDFFIEGRRLRAKTNGVVISIIDFTLSRINTGEAILFLDLSSDPGLFEGPKGDKQSETYRKMKDITDECWEGSFPKTNIFWLQYLVDILLIKKSFKRTKNDERDLRSFRKRLNSYNSAKESLEDSFITNLCEEVTCLIEEGEISSGVKTC